MGKVEDFVTRRNRLRELQRKASGRVGVSLATLLERLSKDLALIVAAGTNAEGVAVVSDAQAAAMLKDIDAEIRRVLKLAGSGYRSAYAAMLAAETEGLPAIYSAFGRTTANRARGAMGPWQDRMRTRYQAGFQKWTADLGRTSSAMNEHLRRSLAQARIEGWNSRRLASELLRDPAFRWENLPPVSERGMRAFGAPNLGKNELLTRRAHMIARTELTAARNESQRIFAEETGMERFININGDPVAAVCKDANAAGAQTWEWWASNLGIPPRHPNCDSDLAAVPDEIDREAIAEYEAASAA